MLKLSIKLAYQLLLTMVGFFFIGSLPYLFFRMDALREIITMLDNGKLRNTLFIYEKMGFYLKEYFSHMWFTFKNLFHLGDYKYYSNGKYHLLFPEFFNDYMYSMKILFISLILGFVLAIIITLIIMLLPSNVRSSVTKSFHVLEAFPDILVIFLLQYIIILIYQKTEILIFDVYSFGSTQPYALPIFCLTIFPLIYITKYLLLLFEEEYEQNYVEFAKGKGMKKNRILLVHILRNCLITLFEQSKVFFWLALSNLLMLEVIFAMNGFISFLLNHGSKNPEIITYGLMMIFLPFYVLFIILKFFISSFIFKSHKTQMEGVTT